MIPDMLRNAPMFKRLESRIKVLSPYMLSSFLFQFCLLISFNFVCSFVWCDFVKGKGSSIGVGRGRAVAMRARVSSITSIYAISFVCNGS